MRRKIPATKSAKKIRRLRHKNPRKNPFCRKPTLTEKYGSTPPICTAVRPPFVTLVAYLVKALRPPPTWQRSQTPPRLKKSKKSLRKSLWGSVQGSWPTPQNESKTSQKQDSASQKSPFFFRSRPGKPNQRKGQNEKFMNFAHFREFWCFSLGKQARNSH